MPEGVLICQRVRASAPDGCSPRVIQVESPWGVFGPFAGRTVRFGFSQLDSVQGNPGVPFAGMLPWFSLAEVLTKKVEVLLALVYQSPGLLQARPSFEMSVGMVGPTPVFLGLDGPEKNFFWPTFPLLEKSPVAQGGEPFSVISVGEDRDRGRVSRDMTRRCAWQA